MKLILKNFRCFLDKTIEIPDKGLILLSGQSGSGKSSILKAINFALYGKETKVVTVGKKKCSVEYHIDTWVIKRTKNPTYLNLKINEDEYQDSVAQNLINERFGDNFLLTNYIQQKAINSFFSLSNVDKTSFLHKLTVQKFDIESLKNKIKLKIKERRNAMLTISSEISTYKTMMLSTDEIQVEECPIVPYKNTSLSEEMERCKKNAEKLSKNLNMYNKLNISQSEYVQSRPMIIQLEQLIVRKEVELDKLKESIPVKVDKFELETNLKKEKNELSVIKQYDSYIQLKQKYDITVKETLDMYEKQRNEIIFKTCSSWYI